MRSRVLIGVGAWLLGAVAATAGSMYAVDHLGQGLLQQHAKEISIAMVNAELALENPPQTRLSPAPYRSRAPRSHPSRRPPAAAPVPAPRAAEPVTRSAGRLLSSDGGTAAASCAGSLARLLYWSPAQGFSVRGVEQGPSLVASVTFTGSTGGVLLRVRCTSAGRPVETVTPFHRARRSPGQIARLPGS